MPESFDGCIQKLKSTSRLHRIRDYDKIPFAQEIENLTRSDKSLPAEKVGEGLTAIAGALSACKSGTGDYREIARGAFAWNMMEIVGLRPDIPKKFVQDAFHTLLGKEADMAAPLDEKFIWALEGFSRRTDLELNDVERSLEALSRRYTGEAGGLTLAGFERAVEAMNAFVRRYPVGDNCLSKVVGAVAPTVGLLESAIDQIDDYDVQLIEAAFKRNPEIVTKALSKVIETEGKSSGGHATIILNRLTAKKTLEKLKVPEPPTPGQGIPKQKIK